MTDAKDTRFTSQTPPPSKRSQRAATEPWEDAVRRAFDDVHAPQDLCQATLNAIEERRFQMQREDSDVTEAVAQVPAGAPRTDAPRAERPRSGASRTDAPPVAEPPAVAPRKRRFSVVKRIAAAAACVLAVAAGIVGFRAYLSPSAFVGLDVNPSVELAVNGWGVVIDAQALNQDGEELLSDVTLQNKSYEDALEAFLASEEIAALGKQCLYRSKCYDRRRDPCRPDPAKQQSMPERLIVRRFVPSRRRGNARERTSCGHGRWQVRRRAAACRAGSNYYGRGLRAHEHEGTARPY